MKKYLSFILFLILVGALLGCGIFFATAAEPGLYIVKAEKTPMLSDVSGFGDFICDVYKGTVLEVSEVTADYGHIYRNSISADGWVAMSDLKKISDEYAEDNIVRIEVSLPDKLTYIVGEEEFDKTGMVVYAVYANNDRVEVTDYTLYVPIFQSIGAKTITVWYKPFNSEKSYSESFTVSVEKIPIKNIIAEGSPKKQFVEAQDFVFDGLTVRVQYLDGRPERIFSWTEIAENSDFTFTVDGKIPNEEPLALGKHTVTVSYMYPEYKTSYEIEVLASQPERLEILTAPYIDSFYSDTRQLDLTGLVLRVIYNNGETKSVGYRECEIVFDVEAAVLGKNTVVIRYMGVETELELNMLEPDMIGIEVGEPGRTVYMQGALFDGANTVVNGIYSSGAKREISGWEIYSFDTSECGEHVVELRYGAFSASYTIYVTASGHLPGDVNADGSITSADARAILRHSVGLDSLTGSALIAADRNSDGTIDAADARLTLRAAVGLEPVLPSNN